MPAAKKSIYAKVAEVVTLVEPIAKEGHNAFQKFDFVKVEQIINFARPLLSDRGVLVIPSGVNDLRIEHYETKNGGTGTSVYGIFEWTWTDGEGSFVAYSIGEANDTGDKAANKAQTAAWKQVMSKVLEIVADDDNDAQHVQRGGTQSQPQAAPQQAQTDAPATDGGHGICSLHNVALKRSAKQIEFGYPASHKNGDEYCEGLSSDAPPAPAPVSEAQKAARASLKELEPDPTRWAVMIADWFPEFPVASVQLTDTNWQSIDVSAQAALANALPVETDELPWGELAETVEPE